MADLLFLSHRVPFPPNKGEKIRAWHILSQLAKSHRVHLGCLSDDPDDYLQSAELLKFCATIGCFPVRPLIQKARALAKLGKKQDALAVSNKSRELSIKAKNDDYVALNDKLQKELK